MPRMPQDGFTLLEVVFSIAFLAIVFLSLINLFTGSFAATIQAGQMSRAAALAQEEMEILKTYSYDELLNKGAELSGAPFTCPGEISSGPVPLDGFEGLFNCYYTIACETLTFNGYPVNGLRVEVEVRQGEDKQVARFASFIRKE